MTPLTLRGPQVPFADVHMDEVHTKGSSTIADHETTVRASRAF